MTHPANERENYVACYAHMDRGSKMPLLPSVMEALFAGHCGCIDPMLFGKTQQNGGEDP